MEPSEEELGLLRRWQALYKPYRKNLTESFRERPGTFCQRVRNDK